MEAFEYLSVLISIILGLGMTQLLLGFSRWLERRARLKVYGPAIAWAGFLLLAHVQTWWSMYGMRLHTNWTFLQFSIVLLQPIVLFLLAVLIFPGPQAQEQDLRTNFFHQRKWFFGLFMVLLMVSLGRDLARQGSLPSGGNLAFHGLLLLVGALGFAAQGPRVHPPLAYFSLSILVFYVAILFADL